MVNPTKGLMIKAKLSFFGGEGGRVLIEVSLLPLCQQDGGNE